MENGENGFHKADDLAAMATNGAPKKKGVQWEQQSNASFSIGDEEEGARMKEAKMADFGNGRPSDGLGKQNGAFNGNANSAS